ncbi:restriction endonuclease subunit S, partial [Methanomethylophilus alvi]|uniref:restriction endonuclease subunit S n=1 Tax=Methanomethylophilus alvi TaxID=1291540 RepID=UPI0037DC5B51
MAIKGSGSPMETVDEYFDMLIKSRFNEMFGDPISNPHEWIKKKMKDVLVIERGGSPRPIDDYLTDDENGLNWIKIGDATEGSYFIDSVKEKIKPEGLKKTRQVYPGDLILSNSMSFGKPYILNISGCIHDGWLVLHDKDDAFNKMFLCFTLSHNSIKEAFKNMARGGVVNNLNKDLVGSLDIIIPPKEIQYDFVHFLLEVDKTKAIYKRIFESFDNLVKSRFIEMFGTIENPKYRTVQISELVSKTIEKVAKTYDSEDFIQYIDISSIIKDSKSVGNMTEYVVKEAPSRAQQCVKKGDILLSNVRPNLKTIAIVDSNENNLVCSSGFSVLRCEKCEPEYLITAITDDMFTDLLMKKATGSSYPAVATKDVLGQEIPYGPEDVQKNFATLVKQVDKSKF